LHFLRLSSPPRLRLWRAARAKAVLVCRRAATQWLRAVRGKEIVCTAKVTKTGRTLTWVDGVITDDTGLEVAHTKFIYYRLKEAGRHFGFKNRD